MGKTTFAQEFLPNYADCKNFVNADLIAQGMAPFPPETAALRAGKMVLQIVCQATFAPEVFACTCDYRRNGLRTRTLP